MDTWLRNRLLPMIRPMMYENNGPIIMLTVVTERLEYCLLTNVSVNVMMFHGGTSFGLTSGSSLSDKFRANPTSYDYDAPLSEAGDLTDKYLAIRDVMSKYLSVPRGPIPRATKKGVYGVVNMTAIDNVWNVAARLPTVWHRFPLTFEVLDISGGLVIYSPSIPSEIVSARTEISL
uniref:Glycoside hydrolase 35 catalytic domain-containing protein n=1 Tax=Scylla olivacea TaxID=85551 RepID=A0A0P4WGY0_SCYOL